MSIYVTKHGKLTVEDINGEIRIRIEHFEASFADDPTIESPMKELGNYASLWAIEALKSGINKGRIDSAPIKE